MNCVLCNVLPNFNEEIILLKLYTKETRNEILLNLMNYTKLIDFRCDNCDLTKLPNLPNSLTNLFCYNNNLTKLPNLPDSLTHLFCYNNNLIELPNLPTSLIELYSNNNKLTYLPNLPKSLVFLECYNNNLIKLPEIPNSLNHLFCYNNNLTYLPDLPNSLQRLACTYNKLNTTYFKNTIYDEVLEQDEEEETYDPETEKYVFYYEFSSLNPLKKIKIINEINSKYRTQKRLKVLNRTLLLEHSARICLNPKRIKRLLDNNEINFFDGSFDMLI